MFEKLRVPARLFLFFPFFLFLAIQAESFASETTLTSGEYHYLAGYDAYLQREYGVCADQFYLAETSDEDLEHQRKLLLSHCQVELGSKAFAAYNLNGLEPLDFRGWKLSLYNSLRQKLGKEIDALDQVRGWAMPYFALGSYSPNSLKSSLQAYGAAGALNYRTWSFNLSAELLNIGFVSSLSIPAYSQITIAAGVAKQLSSVFSIRGNFGYINTNLASLGTTLLGGGTLYAALFPTTVLEADYQQSSYSGTGLPNLMTNQISGALGQTFWNTAASTFYAKFGTQLVLAKASSTYDSTSKFTLNPDYLRYVLDLQLRQDAWLISAQAWIGKEAFGIRDHGGLIYNAAEEHRWGWTAKLGYLFSDWIMAQGAYSKEDYFTNAVETQAYVMNFGVVLNF